MKKLLLALLLALVSQPASAQFLLSVGTPYTGPTTAISATGYPASSPLLFATNQAKLQFNTPFSLAYWVKGTGYSGSSTTSILSTRGGNSTQGFAEAVTYQNNAGFQFLFRATDTQSGCSATGESCARIQAINDGNWHHVCRIAGGTPFTQTIIDGFMRDNHNVQTSGGDPYVASTSYWSLFGTSVATGSAVRDMRVYSRVLSQYECSQLTNLGNDGLIPTGAPFTTGLVANWRFDACDASGCDDSIAGNAKFVPDSVAPIIAVTSPANGTTGLTGPTVPITATCTDSIGCPTVTFIVDGSPIGTSVGPTFSVNWDSTKFRDGAHSISAQGTNAGGTVGTSPTITASTSNSVTGKTFYAAASGNDANDCLTTSSPCKTISGLMVRINANPLIGGDSVLFNAGDTFTITNPTAANVFGLYGTSNTYGQTQNVFSSSTITVGTYGGGTCNPLGGVETGCAKIAAAGTNWIPEIALVHMVNVSNVTVQNLVVDCSGNSAATTSYNVSYGIADKGAGGVTSGGNTIQNNHVHMCSLNIYEAGATGTTFAQNGPKNGFLIQNNLSDGVNRNSFVDYGINVSLVNGTTKSQIVQGNWINNTGGRPGDGQGSGIIIRDGTQNVTDQFNVTSNMGGNSSGCGPYGNWTYQVKNVTLQFNEAYNNGIIPYVPGGCDHGAFDFDGGTSDNTLGGSYMQYNYGHDVDGGCVLGYIGSAGAYIWRATIRYNICEHSAIDHDGGIGLGTGNPVTYAQSVGNVYNNTVYDNGSPTRTATGTVTNSAFSLGSCLSQGVVANNIFATVGLSSRVTHFIGNYRVVCSGVLFKANDWWNVIGSTVQTWLKMGAISGVNSQTSQFVDKTLTVTNAVAGATSGSGHLVRLTVGATAGTQGGDTVVVSGVGGTTEANGTWTFNVVNSTQIDLVGTLFVHTYTSGGSAVLPGWKTIIPGGDTGAINVSPQWSGTPGTGGTCYSSGTPAGPQPCPSVYALAHGSPAIGAGIDLTQAPFSLNVGAIDYYGNTIPNTSCGGTGYNMGADGACH